MTLLADARLRVTVAALAVLALAVPAGILAQHAGRDDAPRDVTLAADTPAAPVLRRFTTNPQWASGTTAGAAVVAGSLKVGSPQTRITYRGTTYDQAEWTAPWVRPGRDFTALIPSWNATTADGTWMEIWARARTAGGEVSTYKSMGRWSTRDVGFDRTSAGSQSDPLARVGVDTFIAQPGVRFDSWQLRVSLHRLPESTNTPVLKSLAVVTSTPTSTLPRTSVPLAGGRILSVPRYSQMIHRGEYPQYGGGGEAWCSPTSLAMLLGYYHSLPSATNYAWVNRAYADPWVDHVARLVYDYGFHGAGNWPFNTGYAGAYLPDTFVTRLADLREAERFIRVGIPLAVSIRFGSGQLSGAPISASAGHLLVVVGFTRAGKVVVNDPAAPSNATVRRIYDRAQFERAWLGGSAGTAYIVRDAAHPLPARGTNRNW